MTRTIEAIVIAATLLSCVWCLLIAPLMGRKDRLAEDQERAEREMAD